VPSFVLTNVVPATPEECFTLSLSVDAHTASMSASGERVVAGVTEGVMRLGDTVTWRATHFGIPFTMTSRISEYDEPVRFVDVQVTGPFRRWRHEHRFEAVPGGTLMTDVVEFTAPAGRLGRVVDRVFLTSYMTGLVQRRNGWLVEALSPPET
jgi:ligand-binding SRPBCC domain-containing protein